MPKTVPRAPRHLAAATRKWWRETVAAYELEPHHLRLLTACAESWDRMTQAREALAECGPVILDRFGQQRSSPWVAVERDSRLAFARLLRELALDVDGPSEPRPPRLYS